MNTDLKQHALHVLSNNEILCKMEVLREIGHDFIELLQDFGSSPELALAQIKVEEAVMWATMHLSAD